MSPRHHQTYEDKVRERGWNRIRSSAWGESLTQARTSTNAIESEGRTWQGEELSEAREFRQKRIRAAREAARIREIAPVNTQIRREIRVGVNCKSVFMM